MTSTPGDDTLPADAATNAGAVDLADVEVVDPAADPVEARRRHRENEAAWDQAAGRYTDELADAIARLRAGESSVHPVERAELGDLGTWCRRAIHLQCASGHDTLSLLLEGATEVVGVDLSGVHIANARRAARELDAPATFHHCDVLDTPHDLDGTADLVYTGRGAICWIHDIDAWAAVIARLLRPGGRVLLFDDHPANWLFDRDADEPVYSGLDYFRHAERNWGWHAEYIGDVGEDPAVKHERLWPIGAVVQALIDAGLVITTLREGPEEYWNVLPLIDPDIRERLPMTFLVGARRPTDERWQRRDRLRAEAEALRADPDDVAAARELTAEMTDDPSPVRHVSPPSEPG